MMLLVLIALSAFHYAYADLSAGMQAYNKHDYANAIVLLKQEAENGDRISQYALGYIYASGQGIPRDDTEAVKWYRMAADQGYAVAQTSIGISYEHGQGVERNLSEARKWFEKAAAQGDPRAIMILDMHTARDRNPKRSSELKPPQYFDSHAIQNPDAPTGNNNLVKPQVSSLPDDLKKAIEKGDITVGLQLAQINYEVVHDRLIEKCRAAYPNTVAALTEAIALWTATNAASIKELRQFTKDGLKRNLHLPEPDATVKAAQISESLTYGLKIKFESISGKELKEACEGQYAAKSLQSPMLDFASLLKRIRGSNANIVKPATSPAVEILHTTNISSKVAAIGGTSVAIKGISGDGAVVVGDFLNKNQDSDKRVIFRYSQSSGVDNLGTFGQEIINQMCISADGSVIAGTIYFKEKKESHIFRYTKTNGFEDLGTMGQKSIAEVNGVSADGSVMVGSFNPSLTPTTPTGTTAWHAFKYSQSLGFEDLGSMGAESAFARGVSADGSLIVGNFHVASPFLDHAYRYSRSDGVQDIGAIGGTAAFATGISNDGSVIVGDFFGKFNSFKYRYNHNSFIYTKVGGVQELGELGGRPVGNISVSADGTKFNWSYVDSDGESYASTAKIILPVNQGKKISWK